jgi:hypothetical protein
MKGSAVVGVSVECKATLPISCTRILLSFYWQPSEGASPERGFWHGRETALRLRGRRVSPGEQPAEFATACANQLLP